MLVELNFDTHCRTKPFEVNNEVLRETLSNQTVRACEHPPSGISAVGALTTHLYS